ncbi:bifunctional phosphopantothenoylcysteine decarboxylase/phosphopantothenate--cysteine ligase CoaBC [Desulforhopalus sp. IMCC35007]|uniref:bifunctional phosphopantothenoylcysteine decarboxylase/phosphopantothenate--cysteine ligase CoaBC n=1 Tax=Desulforhopalus sp. IMCC35007 TaxID=2569543 RepID=UPI0010ADFC41|nr:bifunctional phosphopantothenoylcysteine decarboxylase/phosphopantothenate--cysteine ligase CoaBC [Desulforhopalus sp. IMCC35007]TKB09324.1 bifunctional phosphopantothenoylcysteine decarboxylase/phosphopantothenate--cysteine ligase CoaBC [Desulforhopalus sp. IMCC35007]
MTVFSGKNIVVCVTGSIAAFKTAIWVSDLAKEEALVHVIMSRSAEKFITPLTFGALSGNLVHTDMFMGEANNSMAHIDLGRDADIVVIAPASANTIAKLAAGFADNLITTTVLATRAPVLVFPAMNSRMYDNPATVRNIEILKGLGFTVINPGSGMMACKEEGQGRLPDWDLAKECLAAALAKQDLAGRRILVTAGPTREAIDPARFLGNRSSGKMGYALARCAKRRGAQVILVSGPTALSQPHGVERVDVKSAREMAKAVHFHAEDCDVIIKAAAVADYRPETSFTEKVKKEGIDLNLALIQNPDILFELGKKKKQGQVLVGFAAESENLRQEGQRKLDRKNLDLIAVNDISATSSGFEVDTNKVLLIDRSGEQQLPLTTKDGTADLILDRIVSILEGKL